MLCDVFGAMTERRAYAGPLPWETALERMFAGQALLDPGLLTQFASMVRALKLPRSRWSAFRRQQRHAV